MEILETVVLVASRLKVKSPEFSVNLLWTSGLEFLDAVMEKSILCPGNHSRICKALEKSGR